MIQCDFHPADEKNGRKICRCQNTGCTNAVYADDPETIKPARCKSKVHGEAIARAEAEYPCKHRGELTGETLTGCGCSVPNWRKQLHACEIHGSCVLLRIAKLPGQINCQTCQDRPQRTSSPPQAM